MRHSKLHTAGNVAWVVKNERKDAVPLLAAYARLKMQELVTARLAAHPVRRTTILGMNVSFFDHYWLVEMFEEIFLRKHYHFHSENPSPLIVDVGSNIGLAILFFKRLYPASRVIGFEPDPVTFAVLRQNVSENRLDGVQLVNEAVHDGSEWVHLYADRDTPGSPQATTRSERVVGARSERVRATQLSRHLMEPVDFLKVDVEGAEGILIDDLDRTGKLSLVGRMAVEYHHHLDPNEDALAGMLAALERSGFGYQLEARLAGSVPSPARHYQNVLILAYRKGAPSVSRSSGP
jgi:FkbM family methyltransferase